MKIKDQYIKILKNFLYYNSNFCYDGSRVLRTNSSGVYLEASVPDFTDLPIYTKDLEDILRFITPETEITEDVEGEMRFLILKNENGTVRYRLSKINVVESQVKQLDMEKYVVNPVWFNFNIDHNNYNKLVKNAKLLDCNVIDVYSIDNNKIGLKAYNINDKQNKQYILEIEKEHEHTDKVSTIMLETFELVSATDYNIETGLIVGKSGTERKVTKIKAFCGDIVVKYLILNK